MTSLDERLRDAVLAHLERTGISGRRFGQRALKDPGFVASLKKGRRMTLKTADRVLAELGEPAIGPAFAREVEAFLEVGGVKTYVFGELAAGSPSFVERLRRGVSFRLATVDGVRAWMERNADDAARRAMHRAVAGVPLLAPGDGESQGETTMNIDESRHLSAAEAAAWLGISVRSLYRMREDGRGPDHYRFGYRILYRMEALERWAAENLKRTSPDGGAGRRAT